jgi:nitrous oxide reductase accessory protein NosL
MGWVLDMAVEEDWEEMPRKELGGAKKTSYVIWRDRETVMKPSGRIRLVKAENPSACETVNCKAYISAIALYYL